MELSQAIKIVRKELVIKDEPLKAWNLLELFKDVEGLELERKNTYGMIRHMFDNKEYSASCDIPVDNCELIEPKELITNAGIRYARYQWVIENIRNDKPNSYLDLGCYVGSMVTTIANMGIDSYGVDLTSQVIEVARSRAKEANITNAKFFVGNVEKFDKIKAEAISSMEVIEHVVDPKKYIKHICDLTSNDGWGYVSTPDGPFGDGEGNIIQGWEWDGKGTRGHVRVFTKKTLSKLLDECNCEYSFTNLDDQLLNVKFRRKKK